MAAVLALAFLPLAAFGFETIWADDPMYYFWSGDPVPCDKNACDAGMVPGTRIKNGLHFLIWLVSAMVFFTFERGYLLPRLRDRLSSAR